MQPRRTNSEGRAAVLQTLRKAAVGDETLPSSCTGGGSSGCPSPSSPCGSFASPATAAGSVPAVRGCLRRGLRRPRAMPITPPQACPVAAALTIALATALAGDAMHRGFIKEQRLHSTAVFFQSNSISLEQ